jgi:hypothetical protein
MPQFFKAWESTERVPKLDSVKEHAPKVDLYDKVCKKTEEVHRGVKLEIMCINYIFTFIYFWIS